ncbi:MAG: DUF1648 domain-containing protein [Treponema sp.]
MNTTETETKAKIFDRTFFITTIACIIPALFGIAVYNRLPEQIAIHWNFSGEADNFAHKAVSVFGLPLLCAVLNAVLHITTNFQRKKTGEEKEGRLEAVSKWICVAVSFFASSVTYLYALNCKFDIVKIVLIFCSLVFIILGNYMPKADYRMKHSELIEEEKIPVIKRITGFAMFIIGIAVFATSFFPFGKYVFIAAIAFFIVLNVVLMIIFRKKSKEH